MHMVRTGGRYRHGGQLTWSALIGWAGRSISFGACFGVAFLRSCFVPGVPEPFDVGILAFLTTLIVFIQVVGFILGHAFRGINHS